VSLSNSIDLLLGDLSEYVKFKVLKWGADGDEGANVIAPPEKSEDDSLRSDPSIDDYLARRSKSLAFIQPQIAEDPGFEKHV